MPRFLLKPIKSEYLHIETQMSVVCEASQVMPIQAKIEALIKNDLTSKC